MVIAKRTRKPYNKVLVPPFYGYSIVYAGALNNYNKVLGAPFYSYSIVYVGALIRRIEF